MSVQLYISGESPKSFGSLAEFVLFVRTHFIDTPPAHMAGGPTSNETTRSEDKSDRAERATELARIDGT